MRLYQFSRNLSVNQLQSSLLTKIIVGVALCFVVLIWIFVYSQVNYEKREVTEAAIRANTQKAMAFEQYVVRTVEEFDLITSYIADRYASELQKNPRDPTAIKSINRSPLRLPALREIIVVDRNGDLVATSSKVDTKPKNLSNTEVFQGHLLRQSTALRVHPPSRSSDNQDSLLTMSRRINMPDGRLGGIVSLQVRPSEFTDFLRNVTLNEHDLVSVIGLDGITRARREGNNLSFGQNLSGKLVMQMQEKAPYGSYLGPSSLDGLVRYFSHRRIPQYNLFVSSGISQADVLRPVRKRATAYIQGGVIVSIVTMIAAWFLVIIVTRRIAYNTELRAANVRLQYAQQLAKLGDWSFNMANEEFTWSDDLCTMYEHSTATNVISLDEFTIIVGQHGRQAFRDALKRCEKFGGRQEFELIARLPSGAFSHRRIVCIPDYDASQQLIATHGTDQDVTPGKLLESLQRQVSELSKVDAMNTIAATLAHELNQPLTAASNYLSGSIRMISTRNDAQNDAIMEALSSVREQIYHSGEIIRRVRNLVGNGRSQSEAILLSDVIESAVKHFNVANPDCDVTIHQEPCVQNLMVLADPVQVQQILVNLLRNAAEASGLVPQIAIRTKQGDNNAVNVCVTDKGSGIKDAETDPFSSFTTSKGGSLGLGLAICRTLITSMGGAIWIESTGPHGTSICFSVKKEAAESANAIR